MVEIIISFFSLLASGIAVYLTIKKQPSEIENLDADTISKMQDTIDKQQERNTKQDEKYEKFKEEQEKKYIALKLEFDTYRKFMTQQMLDLQSEASRWRAWAQKLSKQLKDAGIEPEKF
jgi:hypothetical protein